MLKLINNIQIFLSFTHFYKKFIMNFNRVGPLSILILQKINELLGVIPSRTKGKDNRQNAVVRGGNSGVLIVLVVKKSKVC